MGLGKIQEPFEFLLSTAPDFYKELSLGYQHVPKVFLFCDETTQYFFLNHWTGIQGQVEYDFYKFLLKKFNASCFARGGLFINQNEEQEIVLTLFNKDSDDGTDMISKVERDEENKVISLSDYKVYTSPKNEMVFGGLFDELLASENQLQSLETIYFEIKPYLGKKEIPRVRTH